MSLLSNGIFLSFAGYLVMMIVIGGFFCRRNKSISEYLLGGRGLGSWVTAISAQASDMSGWLLMGLPGAIYAGGMGDVWVAIGLALGTLLNWLLVSPRLRVYTEKTNALTLSSFFAGRFRDPTGLLRVASSIIILLFFTIYAASGLVAAGKLFDTMFRIDYRTAVLIGAAAILVYTLLGGYLAVCWTDLIQGMLMVFAIVVVPLVALRHAGSTTGFGAGWQAVLEAGAAKNLSLFPSAGNSLTFLAIVSCAVWGLGYFGQPHILSRFMSIRDVKLFPRSITIAMIWVVISLLGAVAVAFVAMPLFPGLDAGEAEKVFIKLILAFFPPWLGGILLAAIMAAVMSTIDSQLMVSASALTEDFYRRIIRRNATVGEAVWVSRGFVAFIAILATLIALFPSDTIFNIVKFAWGGFGAAFGPVVLMALYSRRTTWYSALAGMIVGTIVMLGWYLLGWNQYMYEILPGFAANLLVIAVVDLIAPQKDSAVIAEYAAVKASARLR